MNFSIFEMGKFEVRDWNLPRVGNLKVTDFPETWNFLFQTSENSKVEVRKFEMSKFQNLKSACRNGSSNFESVWLSTVCQFVVEIEIDKWNTRSPSNLVQFANSLPPTRKSMAFRH